MKLTGHAGGRDPQGRDDVTREATDELDALTVTTRSGIQTVGGVKILDGETGPGSDLTFHYFFLTFGVDEGGPVGPPVGAY